MGKMLRDWVTVQNVAGCVAVLAVLIAWASGVEYKEPPLAITATLAIIGGIWLAEVRFRVWSKMLASFKK